MEIKEIVNEIEKWYDKDDNADSFLYVFVSNNDGKLTVKYDASGNSDYLANPLAQLAFFNSVMNRNSLEDMLEIVSAVKKDIETVIKKKHENN